VPKKGERDKRIKKCEVCRIEYHPAVHQFYRQKYCSQKCKERNRAKIEKKKGIFKGGYSRETHIRLWVDAMGIRYMSAPCHYCGKPLYPDNFVIEHRKPRSKLSSKVEMRDISNLVVSCHACNKEKGLMSYEDFKCLKS
tara:strand:+ start:1047 stop:1463 length:417 start_codon:yes stop_codon:yes gene_type:complete